MSETPDDPLDEILVGGDYQAELRRIAAESGVSSAASSGRKTIPDVEFDEDEDVVRGDLVPSAVGGNMRYDFSVQTPSGATLPVLTQDEATYYDDRSQRYLTDHKFSSVTDLQDLDRVLSTELMLHRYDVWLTLGSDYWGQAVSEKDLLRYVKELSATLQALKKSMSLDKATRDKDQGSDFSAWLEDTRRRAKEFGIMREDQLTTGITLFHEIKARVQTYRNADAIEREELGLDPDKILEWMWVDVFPRFDAVDAYFLQNKARFWKGL